jgi:hypothetical protein
VQLKKTYGVPKSIPSPPDEEIAPARRTRAPEIRRGTATRTVRATGAEPRPSGPMNERFTSRDRVAGKEGHAGRARDQRPAVTPKTTPSPAERHNTHPATKRGIRERDARPERPGATRRR